MVNGCRNYRRVSKHEDPMVSLGRIGVATIMILFSIFACYFVIVKINSISLTDGVVVKLTETAVDTNVAGNRNGMFVTNSAGTRYIKSDGTYARNEWLDSEGVAYYIGENGLVFDGDYRENGQIYTLDGGKLVAIRQDKYYSPEKIDRNKFSIVQTTSYDAFLDDKDSTYDNCYPILIQRRTGSDEKIYLGGEEDKQYSTKYLLTGQDSYLYYLVLGEKEDFSGKLYRVHLGQTSREKFGNNVVGYKVIGDAVFFSQNNNIIRSTNGEFDSIGQYLNKASYGKKEELETPSILSETENIIPNAPGEETNNVVPLPRNDIDIRSNSSKQATTNSRLPFSFNSNGSFNPSEVGPGTSR